MFAPFKEFLDKAFKQNPVGKFIYHTIGEIIMVVVGILIALAINNWQSNIQQQNKLENIYRLILKDVADDTEDIESLIGDYKDKQMLFVRQIAGDMSMEELKQCDSCHTLLHDYTIINIEKKGYTSLAEFNVEKSQDTLNIEIVQFYEMFIKFIEQYEAEIKDDVTENMKHWRDHYAWFSQVYLEEYPDEFLNYVKNDPDYRNRLVFHYSLVYDSYVPALESVHEDMLELSEELESRLNN